MSKTPKKRKGKRSTAKERKAKERARATFARLLGELLPYCGYDGIEVLK